MYNAFFRVDDPLIIINKIMISMPDKCEYFNILNNLRTLNPYILVLNLSLPYLSQF